MKMAVITDEISQDLDEVIQVIAPFNVNAIELRSVWDKQVHQLTNEEVQKIEDICKKNNIEVCAISSPFFKCNLNEIEIEQQIVLLERVIEVAKKLKCKIIRGFSFWQEKDFEAMLPYIVNAFEIPIQMMKEADMQLALELDPSVYTCNGQRLAQLVEQINSPYVSILWDPGNDIYSEIPEVPFPDGYNYVKPRICHVHIKDAINNDGNIESVKIGTGEVNWIGQLKALKEDGYTGYISLETHYRKGAVISEDLMKRPGGSAFSEGAIEASSECLEALEEMLGGM